jgi:predicted DNA-binding transcriptional regulator AlpA
MQHPDSDLRLIPFPVLKDRLGGLSRSTIWRMVTRKDFPRPIRASAGRALWLESEIDAWIAAKAEHRAA